ncbi:MAG: L-aspartate oxidase [Actinobacteria bacterium]|nr:L-aspartate oxidase [Actinomycetota bacterium]
MSPTTVPMRLAAPEASWTIETDVVILGSGAAGLSAALAARPMREVVLVTKDTLAAGSTHWAQGGLAAVLDPADSLENHVRDTLAAGAGLCDEDAVRALVTEAPTAIRYLMRLGASFDEGAHDELALTREGGHSHRRIVHAGGDQSGAEVQRTLDESVRLAGVTVVERAFGLDLIVGTTADGRRTAAGVRVAMLDASGGVESVGEILARAVVVATGGYGQVYASTSNPPAVTGDGIALALRAGVEATDLEFIQFHPTVLWCGPEARGQQALISEAVRGEGAFLIDAAGRRVMEGVHPQADLAPRDVVATAISKRMSEAPAGVDDHVYLDARAIERIEERFPTITAKCREAGIDPARELIPVAPAAHYVCGGVAATLDGTTSLPGFFVVGEAAATGVHGANRLASNSLTEGIVAGTRLGRALSWNLPEAPTRRETDPAPAALIDSYHRAALRSAMSRWVGVLRTPVGLGNAGRILDTLARNASARVVPTRQAFEATNMLTIAAAVVESARVRSESRGCHRRTDADGPLEEWTCHLTVRLESGDIVVARGERAVESRVESPDGAVLP